MIDGKKVRNPGNIKKSKDVLDLSPALKERLRKASKEEKRRIYEWIDGEIKKK